MQALQYIEIDVDYCSLTYGVAPCTAAIGVTGDIKCFNTLATCQDRPNFTNVPVTLRFAVPTAYLPNDIECIASISTITFDSATISLDGSLGQRATLTVAFKDHPDSDTGAGGDKYLADRTYNPWDQGTYFGKFRVRQPFVRGRALRWINGELGQALADMETRHFLIDSFTGPTPTGEFKIVAKDVLKLADGDRALAPATSTGYLSADITAIATAATLLPAGIGNTEYPASGYVAIGGSEICSFTRAADALTLTRAQLNTVAVEHKAQDRVQLVLRYVSQDPATILSDLLQTYAGVPASQIPDATWLVETGTYNGQLYSANIAQPTAVNTLASELLKQAGAIVWPDDRNQEIGLRVLHKVVPAAEVLDESNVQENSLTITDQPTKRRSQFQTYFGPIDPLKSLTDPSNFRSVAITLDANAEADYGSAAIEVIYSRWIPALGRAIADRLNDILLGRYRDPPRNFKFSVLRGAVDEILMGGGYNLAAWPIQDATGAADTTPIWVTRLKAKADLIEVEAEEGLYTTPTDDLTGVRNITIDSNAHNINLRDIYDIFYDAPVGGSPATQVALTIHAGVIVGSTDTLLPALDIGTWPAGVIITIKLFGRIQGKGGQGGYTAAPAFGGVRQNGTNGGTALYSRHTINIESVGTDGEIWGGGGGGGPGTGLAQRLGGGGAGFDIGLGAHPPATAFYGIDGTTEAGGAGSNGGDGLGNGGNGGGPGLAGSASGAGSAGSAIDGVSFCTFTSGAGDRRGAEIN